MPFAIRFTSTAAAQLDELERDRGLAKRLKAVRKAIGHLEVDPRQSSLQSQRFRSLRGPGGEETFVSNAEQGTPAAYRVIWCYGPGKGQITIVAIVRHP